MWCWCSNVVVIPPHTTTPSSSSSSCYKPLLLVPSSVSATSLPRRRHRQNVTTDNQVGELGNALMANLESNSKQQISGSDVLWALQRASNRKKKKKHERGRDSSSNNMVSHMEETCVDYTNVRPLCINDHWGPKLDELENRLRHLSDTI
ncbi:uncharacterized protein LOC123889535 [Trifolium pratense]|uniref:uncharacterized protein LOC123889535 n=1 Tax=Trifolium pratense TaxID=57577 RepID=UPI001E695ECE|nr:uncharacterized protein LOC123889535 [Trifolium pratense]